MQFSLEFFPAQTDEALKNIVEVAQVYKEIKPLYATITYGAGGYENKNTLCTVNQLTNFVDYELGAHISGAGIGKAQLRHLLRDYCCEGIKQLVVIRGDVRKNPVEIVDSIQYAYELVQKALQISDFDIAVGAYPEKHPEASSLEQDIHYLNYKLECGANKAITQFFYDNTLFYKFMDKCIKFGITKPIIPGLMPIFDGKALNFVQKCKCYVPPELVDKTDPRYAYDYFAAQIIDLIDNGFDRLHFYTLNKPDIAHIIKNLNL